MYTHTGGGGGVAGMNAQKLIKDRVVCPAGAWCPSDLTVSPSTNHPRPKRSHSALRYISDDVSTQQQQQQWNRRRGAVGLIDRPLFLPGRPQKLKTTTRETTNAVYIHRECVCLLARKRKKENCRRSMVFPEFSHQRAFGSYISNDIGTRYTLAHLCII